MKTPGLDLTRRGRRRLIVIASAGIIGLSVPLWVPRLLSALPVFRVERVTVVGTHYVGPDEVTRLIALEPDASVWDRVDILEDRIRTHPMIRETTVRRDGLNGLLVAVIEKRPVALVATPELRAVNGDGRLLPIEPSRAALSLPIISGITGVEDGLVLEDGARELAGVLEELDRSNADFVSVVSEASLAPDGGYRFLMLPTADAGSVFLPSDDPVGALHRVSLALGQIEDRRVARADARFDRQVVITRAEGR
ncbi:MAG: cell division protein FtsQ/DivIB [Gemmatimonadota bacterium]